MRVSTIYNKKKRKIFMHSHAYYAYASKIIFERFNVCFFYNFQCEQKRFMRVSTIYNINNKIAKNIKSVNVDTHQIHTHLLH